MIKYTEKKIENECKNILLKHGIYHFKNHGSAFTEPGRPDIVACMNGKFYAIEIKKPGGIISKVQEFTKKKIEKSGGFYHFIDDPEDLKNIIIKELTKKDD